MNAIWNLTRLCPWDCSICCVSAIHTKKYINDDKNCPEQVLNQELNLYEKINILINLAKFGLEIDFSGGDPLYYEDDFQVVKKATELLPAEKISVSTTGKGITDNKRIEILKKVDTVEITLDCLNGFTNSYRPKGYDSSSMIAISRCVQAGIKVRAVTVLHRDAIGIENLQNVYEWLCKNHVPEWSILKPSPVGRGNSLNHKFPSNQEYVNALLFLEGLKGCTKIIPQHTFDVLKGEKTCHAALETIGILPNGKVTACAWALDDNCQPLDGFYMGKMPEESILDILKRAWAKQEYSNRSSSCRIVSLN